jgi:hypothetical protein
MKSIPDLLNWLTVHKPKKATGIYITADGITFGYRTNPDKYPENFLRLW